MHQYESDQSTDGEFNSGFNAKRIKSGREEMFSHGGGLLMNRFQA
jgi:hypothetical protein